MSKVAVKITADNVKGAEDGQNTKDYTKGETYEVCEELANIWIDGELAEPVKGKAKPKAKEEPKPEPEAAPEPESKSVEAAPENKAVQAAEENKDAAPAEEPKDEKPKAKAKK
jgi:hypothetical protein